MASIIKESGIKFDQELLNKTGNSDLYSLDTEKAFALGVYTGDLGYINIYEKTYIAMTYLGAIKNIAEDLKVGQFFDFETIKRLGSNSNKLDSLLYISTLSFERMDNFLRDQKRGKLSALIVTGTWLESLFLATHVVKVRPDERIIERIAEQKMILDQILIILGIYEKDEFFTKLAGHLNLLKNEYDKVSLSYIYKEPETREINGRLVIVDNSRTEVNISHEQLQKITEIVDKIRQKFIFNNFTSLVIGTL